MADEIPGQNRIEVHLAGELWCATIAAGHPRPIRARANDPLRAVARLIRRLSAAGYVFDESWQPRP